MAKKTKIALLLLAAAAVSAVFLFLFRQKVVAPHPLVFQNPDSDAVSEIETPQENPAAVLSEELPAALPKEESPAEKTSQPEIAPPSPEKPVAKGSALKIISRLVSWGFSPASDRKIDTIIIHSSYNALGGEEYDTEKLIAEYKEYGVAPHYLIDRQGKIYLLVEEKNIAYHAGQSSVPDGRSQVNNFSLGIEMMNTQEDNYTAQQYAALNSLLAKIKSDYSIKYTLGHNDISPGRKTDPWNFDWKKVN
jgi:hypothetical protein